MRGSEPYVRTHITERPCLRLMVIRWLKKPCTPLVIERRIITQRKVACTGRLDSNIYGTKNICENTHSIVVPNHYPR